MTDTQRKIWTFNLFTSPIIAFTALFFGLYKVMDMKMGTAFGIAAIVAALDFFILRYVINRMQGHQ